MSLGLFVIEFNFNIVHFTHFLMYFLCKSSDLQLIMISFYIY